MSEQSKKNDVRKPAAGKSTSAKTGAAKSGATKSGTGKSASGKSDIVVKKTYKSKKTDSTEIVRKGLKHSSGFMFSLLVNVLIVFCLIKIFTMAFHFGYSVFGNVAYHPGAEKYVVVDIPADSSVLQIGEALEDAEIIESKWVFAAKVKIKNLAGKMKSGQFNLSAAMTYDQILDVLCPTIKSDGSDEDEGNGIKLHKVEEDGGASSNEGAGIDYKDPDATTEEGAEGEEGSESEDSGDDGSYEEEE